MDYKLQSHIDLLTARYPELEMCKEDILKAYHALEECFLSEHKLLIAGNGGSSSDSEHIVGELMKGFILPRKCSERFAEKLRNIDSIRGAELADKLQGGLPAISLSGHQSLNTAFLNDVKDGGKMCFAQQVYGYGKKGDVFLGISTSGNASNVLYAAVVAKALGLKVIALTGADGGKLKEVSDITVRVAKTETYMVQELHLPVYHCLCLMLEKRFFG